MQSHQGSSPAPPRSVGRRVRPRVPSRAALRHRGRAEGAVWGTSLRRCSGPVSTRGRGWARCPPAAQVPRACFPWRAPVFPQVGVRARVPLLGVSFAISESQRPDDRVCCVQRRRSGACFAWGRKFRHCCVAVPKSRGWGADFPWLVHVLLARLGVGGGACTPVPRAGIRVCVWALGAPPPAVGGGPVARGIRGRALSPLRLPSSWELSGPAVHVLWARFEGRLRSGAPPPPTVRPLDGLLVRLHSCCGRGCAGVGARRCPLGLHALWGPRSAGVVGAVPGGVARHGCEGRPVPGAVPPPVAHPLGGPSRSTTHKLWARACGCGGPAPSPRPACLVGAACRGGGRGPLPGGDGLPPLREASGVRRCPSPSRPPFGRLAGVPRPVCPGCGRCGRGDPPLAPQRAPLRAGVARRGGGERASPGG